MGNRGDILDANQGPPTRNRPPANVIVPQKKVAEWDGLLTDIVSMQDSANRDAATRKADLIMAARKIDAMALWNLVRDVIVILLLVAMCCYLLYRSNVVDSWRQSCAVGDVHADYMRGWSPDDPTAPIMVTRR